MKLRFLAVILLMMMSLSVNASEINRIDYKNIKPKSKLSFVDGVWTTKVNKNNQEYYTKEISPGTSNFSEFYAPDGSFLFSTGTQYEFIDKGHLIGYSNSDLKFYEYVIVEGLLQQRELSYDEIQAFFPKFNVVKVSEFSNKTNSLKVKKGRGHLKLILLNDTDRYFYHYDFTSNNAKFKKYQLKGFLDISKKGMIQFSHFGDNTKANPWFILLVR